MGGFGKVLDGKMAWPAQLLVLAGVFPFGQRAMSASEAPVRLVAAKVGRPLTSSEPRSNGQIHKSVAVGRGANKLRGWGCAGRSPDTCVVLDGDGPGPGSPGDGTRGGAIDVPATAGHSLLLMSPQYNQALFRLTPCRIADESTTPGR